MTYLDLFLGFLEVGFFSFGGGYVAIPLIRDVVLSHGWLTEDMLTHMIAVSESTPGPIMVNLATYIGSSQGGLLGALIATLTVVMPAFLFIVVIMAVLGKLVGNRYYQAILRGLKPCIIGIILATGIYMAVQNCVPKESLNIDLTALLLTGVLSLVYFGSRKFRKNGISPILLILLSAVAGVIVYGI